MSRNGKFEQEVLIELLELAVSKEKLIKQHVENPNSPVFEESQYKNWYEPVYTSTTKYYHEDCSVLDNIRKSHGIRNDSDSCVDYIPTLLKITFKDFPPLYVKYKAIETKTETTEDYFIRPKWYQKKVKTTVRKIVTDFTHAYEISQGSITGKISLEKFDNILKDLRANIEKVKHKSDLEKAIHRLHDLKGTNKK